MNLTSYIGWFLTSLGSAAVVFLMRRNNYARRFPVFFSLELFRLAGCLISAAILFTAGHEAYVYTFWISAAIQYLLLFAVLVEITYRVAEPYGHLPKSISTAVFLAASLVAIASGVVAGSYKATFGDQIFAACSLIGRILDFAWPGAFLTLAAFSSWMGAGWNKAENAITTGICIEFMASVIADVLFAHLGSSSKVFAVNLQQVITLFSFLPWVFVFGSARKSIQPPPLSALRSAIRALEVQHAQIKER